MKYNINSKVIFKTEKISSLGEEYRYVYYKIDPNELSYIKRTLFNPWRKMVHSYIFSEGLSGLFSPDDYLNMKERLKTFGDVCQYLQRQIDNSNDIHNKLKEKWDS